jgi:MFS family permease
VGAVLLAVMVVVELRKRLPLIDLRLLGNRLFRSCNGVMFLASAAFIGTLYAVSLFFQDGRGLSALAAGLSTFPEALGVMAGAQLTSRVLYPVLGPRRNIALGLAGVTVFIGLMSLIGSQTSLWWMRLLMFCLGVAMPWGRCLSPPRPLRSRPSHPRPPGEPRLFSTSSGRSAVRSASPC